MTKRTILAVIVLLVILGAIFAIQQKWGKKETKEDLGAVLSIGAFNQTRNVDATSTNAQPNDILVYTLTAENKSDKKIEGHVVEVNIEDISELATLIDAQGANYNSTTNALAWTPLDIEKNSSIEKKFTVRIKEELPANSDLVMNTKFNNELAARVSKSTVAGSDTVIPDPTPTPAPPLANNYTSPTTGVSEWLAITFAFVTTGMLFVWQKKRGDKFAKI